MTEIILGFLIILLSLIGFVTCIKFLLFRLYKSKNDKTIMLISPLSANSEDIEYILRSCAIKIKWMGKVRPYRVICLDNGIDNSSKEICLTICNEYDFMDFMTKEELNKLLYETDK